MPDREAFTRESTLEEDVTEAKGRREFIARAAARAWHVFNATGWTYGGAWAGEPYRPTVADLERCLAQRFARIDEELERNPEQQEVNVGSGRFYVGRWLEDGRPVWNVCLDLGTFYEADAE